MFYDIAIKFQPPNLDYTSDAYKEYVQEFNDKNQPAMTAFNNALNKLTISQSDELERTIYDDARSSQLIDLDNPMNEFYKGKGEFAALYSLSANKKERRQSVIAEPNTEERESFYNGEGEDDDEDDEDEGGNSFRRQVKSNLSTEEGIELPTLRKPMGGYRRTRRNRSNKRKNISKRRKSQKKQKRQQRHQRKQR
jgi:hypothetical protein